MSLRDDMAGRTRLIRDTQTEIERLLRAAAGTIGAVLSDDPSDYEAWRLPAMRREIQRLLGEVAPQLADVTDAALPAAWQAAIDMADAVIKAPGLAAALPALDAGQLDAMRAFTTEKIKSVTLGAMDKINDQLALTMIGTQTPFDAVQEVTRIVGESTRKRATSIVRTELATAYSIANQERMTQWSDTVPGLQKRWLKSGKVYPRQEHVVIHGQVRDIDKPFDLEGGAVQMMQPHDPSAPVRHRINCGCVAVPVVPGYVRTAIDEKEQEAAEEAAHSKAVLAAMREPVPSGDNVGMKPSPTVAATRAVGPMIGLGQRPGLFDLPDMLPVVLSGNELGIDSTHAQLRRAASEHLRQLQHGGGLYNHDTGWVLRISRDGRKKIGGNPQQSLEELKAVAAIEQLAMRAVLTETHADLAHHNPFVDKVYRLYAPLKIGDALYRAKLTVKGYTNNGEPKMLHALAAVEIENAPLGTFPASSAEASVQPGQPTTGRTVSIVQLLAGASRQDGTPFEP